MTELTEPELAQATREAVGMTIYARVIAERAIELAGRLDGHFAALAEKYDNDESDAVEGVVLTPGSPQELAYQASLRLDEALQAVSEAIQTGIKRY